jgi:hypothetical protein
VNGQAPAGGPDVSPPQETERPQRCQLLRLKFWRRTPHAIAGYLIETVDLGIHYPVSTLWIN